MTRRIFSSIFAVAAVVLLLSLSVVLGVLYGHYSDVQWKQLESGLELTRQGVEASGEAYLHSIRTEDLRMTWIDSNGMVIFDTQADAASMDNHAQREEIKEALVCGKGTSRRYSNTLTKIMLYSAVRLEDGTVVRIAAAQDSILALLLDVLFPLLIIFCVAVLTSMFLAGTLAKKIVDPLNDLNLDAPMQAQAYDELSPLLHRIEKQNRQIHKQLALLKEKTDQFEQITASMNEGLVLLNGEGKILSINPAATKLFETGSACVGLDFLVVDRSAAMREGIQKTLDGKHSEFHVTKHDCVYQIGVSPILSNGKLLGSVVLAFDVTEQVNSRRNRQEFTANVSHELKTPLQSILNSAQLLQSGLVKPEDNAKFTGYICSEAERLLNLINDVIRLSRLDEGGAFPKERVDLYQVASQVLQSLLPAADKRKITVELLGEHTVITGEPQLAYELIYNLCDNAIRYNKEGGKVIVFVRKDSVTVKDTGIGISKEHHRRIFERFYRVDKSHSRETGGTGLGLSIAKHAAQRLNAGIELDSTVGEGTEIRVTF